MAVGCSMGRKEHGLAALQQNQSSIRWRHWLLSRHCGCGVHYGARRAQAGGRAAEAPQCQKKAFIVQEALWV